MAKKVPQINASSMADISFLLLIFFLVTTSMDVNQGLARRLPACLRLFRLTRKWKIRISTSATCW